MRRQGAFAKRVGEVVVAHDVALATIRTETEGLSYALVGTGLDECHLAGAEDRIAASKSHMFAAAGRQPQRAVQCHGGRERLGPFNGVSRAEAIGEKITFRDRDGV
jgi:hypothetical protein